MEGKIQMMKLKAMVGTIIALILAVLGFALRNSKLQRKAAEKRAAAAEKQIELNHESNRKLRKAKKQSEKALEQLDKNIAASRDIDLH
jgi:uncharacterized protein HemX